MLLPHILIALLNVFYACLEREYIYSSYDIGPLMLSATPCMYIFCRRLDVQLLGLLYKPSSLSMFLKQMLEALSFLGKFLLSFSCMICCTQNFKAWD